MDRDIKLLVPQVDEEPLYGNAAWVMPLLLLLLLSRRLSKESYDDDGKAFALGIIDEEPVYCKYKQLEFGLMVGCDGSECRHKQLHLQCLGLNNTPPGEIWLCLERKVKA